MENLRGVVLKILRYTSPTYRSLKKLEEKVGQLNDSLLKIENKLDLDSSIVLKYLSREVTLNLGNDQFYDYVRINRRFHDVFGVYPDLVNPKTFNEKIQWRKLFDRQDIYTELADKYKVRAYVQNRLGKEYLIPLYLATSNPDDIHFDELPDEFVVKANNGCDRIRIIRNRRSIDQQALMRECRKWLLKNYYEASGEWQYKNITPLIVIEKLLVDEQGKLPCDYKFHCFNGRTEYIQVDFDRHLARKTNNYDRDWNLLPFTTRCPNYNKHVSSPSNLTEMIETAEKLSSGFSYVRVDLYSISRQIYFGELTLTPACGFQKFYPEHYDHFYGEKFRTSADRKLQNIAHQNASA